jgi:predicted phosphoribosyltransferase
VAKLETIQIPDPFLFIQVSKRCRQHYLGIEQMLPDSLPRDYIDLYIIAKELRTKLDLVVTRKIGAPFNHELAIGAVMPDGSYFLNDVAEMINISQNYIESQIRKEVKEIERRLIEFRGRKEYDNN